MLDQSCVLIWFRHRSCQNAAAIAASQIPTSGWFGSDANTLRLGYTYRFQSGRSARLRNKTDGRIALLSDCKDPAHLSVAYLNAKENCWTVHRAQMPKSDAFKSIGEPDWHILNCYTHESVIVDVFGGNADENDPLQKLEISEDVPFFPGADDMVGKSCSTRIWSRSLDAAERLLSCLKEPGVRVAAALTSESMPTAPSPIPTSFVEEWFITGSSRHVHG